MSFHDILIDDFTHPAFEEAFQRYFAELNIPVKDWDKLFAQMNEEKQNLAWLRLREDGSPVGFLQFTVIRFASWFFLMDMGFLREFWVAPDCRGQGHGSRLLALTEQHLADAKIHRAILTSDTAPGFYLKHGYREDREIVSKNKIPVFVKDL